MQGSLGSSRFVSKPVSFIAIAVATLGLAACGGGGGGGGNDNPPPSGPSTPGNTAPSVNAGADQTIQLPTNSVDLQGSATDADNNTLTYTWTSSPADGVTFDSASAAATKVTFTNAGTYTLTLTANDGTTTGTDTVVITVTAANAPANTAPTVDAGVDQTVQLPTATANLAATATDAENDTLTYAWAASPADGVTFADAAAATTTATFTTAGTYTLTLTVSDGTNSVTDTTAVTVQAAGELAWPGVDPNDPATDPNHGWVAAAPADVGMDSALLVQAETYALTGGGSGLIARHGKLVHKWGNIDSVVQIKSATKSIGSIALGLAVDQSLIALTDTAQSRYAAFGADPTDPTPSDATALSQITIQQLATHTAGFAKDGSSHVDLVAAPGTEWRYSDGSLNWLADTLTNVMQRDLSELLAEKVWTPLNITSGNTTGDLRWRIPAGANVRPAIGSLQMREFASGITTNANAMGRVGLLFLRKGVWKDQRILSEQFINTVSTPRPEAASAALVDPTGFPSANLGHGVMWWTNATKQLANVPADAYWAWGLGDSLIVVIPSLDLVIARLGNNPDDPNVPHWRKGSGGGATWDGNYQILDGFLTPIVQSVTTP